MSIARPLGLAAPFAVCLLVAATVTGSALAQAPSKAERAAARDAYDKGTLAFEHGDYVTALDSFVKANALIPSVQAMYWIAQAQDKLGHTAAAIEAYEAITARADFAKLSEDKQAVVNSRLAALKTPPAPPAPAAAPSEPPPSEPPPPTEPPPAVATLPPPPVSEPPPAPADDDVLPKRNTAELGALAGVMFISNANNLQEYGKPHTTFGPAFQLGARAAFFPVKVFGVEAEYAHGIGHCDCNDGNNGPKLSNSARFDAVRGHLIGQLPTSRLIPFALIGAGLLHSHSDKSGADNDFAFDAGVGLKVMASRLLVPRLDARVNMTQRRGGGFTDGVAFNAEILAGLSFRLGD